MPSKEYYENREQLLVEVAKKRNLKQAEHTTHINFSEYQLPERKMSWKYAGILTLMLLSGGYFSRSSKLPEECEGFAGFLDVGNNDWRTSEHIELYMGRKLPIWSDAACAAALFVQSEVTAPISQEPVSFFTKGFDSETSMHLPHSICIEVTKNRGKIKPPRNESHIVPCHQNKNIGQIIGQDPDNKNKCLFRQYLFPGPSIMLKRGYPKHQPETKGAAMLARR